MLRPKIKEYFDVFPTAGDRYQVRGTEYVSVLKGGTVKQVFGHLLPLLNGEYTTAELTEKLRDVASPATIRAFIRRLGESGILEDAHVREENDLTLEQTKLFRSQMVFFEIAGQEANGTKCQKALLESKVSIVGTGDLAARIATECGMAGVGTVAALNLSFERPPVAAAGTIVLQTPGLDQDDGESLERYLAVERPGLLVLALDRAEPEYLERVNELAIGLGIPLLHSRISGTQGIVGPLTVPGKTACLKCHHLRMVRNYDFYDEYLEWEKWIQGDGRRKRSAIASIGPFAGIVAGMAALEIIKKLSSFYEPELYGKFLRIDALTLEVIRHEVLRIPRCPACGKTRNKPSFTPWLEKK